MPSCSVLVIGGSGFLGQHVVSLLQSRAPFVTEIKTLDIVPYEKKLDHEERVPVRVFTGSVTDESLVTTACRDANVVIHVATVIDISMFPDVEKTNNVNVNGPAIVVKVASETQSVYGYIFSSSVALHLGKGGSEGFGLTEESPLPHTYYYEPYASSKRRAEQIVLAANGPSLSTLVLRPSIMYGDLDYSQQPVMDAAAKFGKAFELVANGARHDRAYVGNVAWGFACAVKTLYEQRASQKVSGTGNDKSLDKKDTSESSRDISGEVFIMTDDTEPVSTFAEARNLLEPAGVPYIRPRVPVFMLTLMMRVMYVVFTLLSLFGIKKNFQFSRPCIDHFYREYGFSYKKANTLLGYTPIFEETVAKKKTVEYFRRKWAETICKG